MINARVNHGTIETLKRFVEELLDFLDKSNGTFVK